MGEIYLHESSIEGRGVFAERAFHPGEIVLEYKGALVRAQDIPEEDFYGAGDRYVQIGIDQFLGPSGEIDDWLNHSCDPSCGLKMRDGKVFVVALRPIVPREEITWDYSTTLDTNGAWEMSCHCKSPQCRGKIRDFKTLPPETQERYINLGIVPEYILEDKK